LNHIRLLGAVATLTATLCATAGCSAETARPTAASAVPDASLTNTYWKVGTLSGASFTPADGDREPHLVLDDAGQAKGFAGCNRFFGSYERVENALRFGPLGATRMACEHAMDVEDRLLAALARVRFYEIRGDSLTLRDEAGDDLVGLEAVYLP